MPIKGTFGLDHHECFDCGYDLRGTNPQSVCPECGLAYQASKAGLRVENGMPIIRFGSSLPTRCIKSNAPADAPALEKTYYYISPWWGLLLVPLLALKTVWLYAVIYFALRKKVTIYYHINEPVRIISRIWKAACIAFLLLLADAVIVAALLDMPFLSAWIVGMGILVLLVGSHFTSPFTLRSGKRKGEFRLSGCSPEFVRALQRQLRPQADGSDR
jgi:hypothetical protein